MKQLNILQTAVHNKIIAIVVAVTIFFIARPVCAQAQNLTKAKDALGKLKEQLDVIIPIAAGIILLCLAIGYAGRYIEKGTFVRWAVGVVIAGSAVQLTAMLFKPNGG
ncbi:VirB2 family type IV secretion system major pilin TrwL [Bartonella sp. DB5-6]|uniref:VirB2 family type IV secretion system major pilin TrwL n=1 Tax=Bartonella sp. DB5-6 TaxID=1094755 RepID=UPI0003067240|nr:VirB2 family type IV secretion system major pilin TrwL [Bartonella sp. DB5-6]